MANSKPYRYEEARKLLASIIGDLNILSGDTVGPSGVSWQDVAGTLACNLKVLALRIEAARAGCLTSARGVTESPVVFPSIAEAIDGADLDAAPDGWDGSEPLT
jgi:hypothetical protein